MNVKSMQNLLFKVLCVSNWIKNEKIHTTLTRVEACFRLIIPLLFCPTTDQTSLTTGHFRTIRSSHSNARERSRLYPNRLDRCRPVEQFSQYSWKRLNKERILSYLKVRCNWTTEKGPKNTSVGSIVLIRNENLGSIQVENWTAYKHCAIIVITLILVKLL